MMNNKQLKKTQPRKPAWLKKTLPKGSEYEKVRAVLGRGKLHSVCQEAKCPNIWECFSQETATFLILGDRCTRNCRFCAIAHGPLNPPDPEEPGRVGEAAKSMGLSYVVITSVTRDPRLYPMARPEAVYRRSLDLLKNACAYAPDIPTKSGLMLGLGESPEEVDVTLKDLLETGCSILTLGQYLQPSKEHLPVERFIPPSEFDKWREKALEMGFSQVASGPFVRSSYHAKELYQAVRP
jgi:lipoic acid synthetase